MALQNRMSEVLHVDIHPGAQIGRGVLIDHATGVVGLSNPLMSLQLCLRKHISCGS